MQKRWTVQQMTLCGVMAAVVFVMTYVPKLPVPITGGYVHLGDGAIFLSVMLIGPLGVVAAAIGSMLSDLVGGYMVYILPTLVIKGLVAWTAWHFYRAGKPMRNLLAFALAEAVMVAGYYLSECVVAGIAAATAAILPNVAQGIVGGGIGMLCMTLVPRLEKMLKVAR